MKRSKSNRGTDIALSDEADGASTGEDGSGTGSGWRIASIVIAAIGLITSLVILYVYFRLVNGAGAYTSFCSINATVNCDDVLLSSWGKLFGIPVAIPAAFDYLLLLILLLVARGPRSRALAYAMLLVGWNLVFTLYMASASFVVLHELCLLCATLYTVNLLGALATAVAWNRSLFEPWSILFRDLAELPRRPAILVPLLAVVAVAFISVIAYMTSADQKANEDDKIKKFVSYYVGLHKEPLPMSAAAPAKGSRNPVVTFIEFSDFQCPHCQKGAQRMQEVLERWPDKVQVVFHNYPLDQTCNKSLQRQIHEHACHAAVAAQCAMRQNKFWPYHDMIFAHQDNLKDEDLQGYAAKLGLDTGAFQACMQDPSALKVVTDDVAAADQLKIESTPTFFINNKRVVGSLPMEYYEAILAIESQQR